ncbi:hypothetical protein GTW25_19810 [Aliihoeflea aestuarii]|jgi:hypothetical protein|uniref:hypothetical protein n=1 Tax=Aliihoeflea aestuarii TaxID=453840 RepID=UPI0020965E25|nr:hypothetical protein [Aliihoeflea aestuarii]MCO6393269.1 hypothetical protein [Aliihoeflea aestuarii]
MSVMKQRNRIMSEFTAATDIGERARYLRDMAIQMRKMAATDGHEFAAYIFDMAASEMNDRCEASKAKPRRRNR